MLDAELPTDPTVKAMMIVLMAGIIALAYMIIA